MSRDLEDRASWNEDFFTDMLIKLQNNNNILAVHIQNKNFNFCTKIIVETDTHIHSNILLMLILFF